MNKTSRNIKVLTLILLTSALLITAVGNIAVKAQSTPSVYVYTSQGGSIEANGTTLTGDSIQNYNTSDTVSFTTTPGTNYAFLCWVWSGTSVTTSTSPTLTEALGSSSCAIQALFVPTSNATITPSGSGTATVVALASIGGTTSPSAGATSTPYTNYTVGTAANFVATPDANSKFLYWLVVSSLGSNYYTTSSLDLSIPSTTTAIQAFFVPTSSTVAIPEFSSAIIVALAAVLIVSAFGTYAYKRTKK